MSRIVHFRDASGCTFWADPEDLIDQLVDWARWHCPDEFEEAFERASLPDSHPAHLVAALSAVARKRK